MLIRPYRQADVAGLIELFQQTVRLINSRDYTPAQVEAWATGRVDPEKWRQRLAGNFSLVAELEGRLAGFGELEPDGNVDTLFVDHRLQGRGVATALLNALEGRARRLGLTRLTTQASLTARPFFQARGFKALCSQSIACLDQKLINFQMEKVLEPEQ